MGKAYLILAIALLCLPSMNGAAVIDGWSIETQSEIVFVGDPINITVHGPLTNASVRLLIIDANATLVTEYFPFYRNGTAQYNHTTTVDVPQGIWIIRAFVEGVEAASVEIRLVFDEDNFRDRRLAILEKENERNKALISHLIDDVDEVKNQMSLWRFMIPSIFFSFVLLYYFYARLHFSLWVFARRLKIEFIKPVNNWRDKLHNYFAAPWSGVEQAQFHARRRTQPRELWPEEAMADRAHWWAAKHGSVTPRRVPVIKARVVTKPVQEETNGRKPT